MNFLDLVAQADLTVRQQLGGTVTYVPGSGPSVDVLGIFDASYVKIDIGPAGIASVGPAVFLRQSDLPTDPVVDDAAQVIANGVTYTVREAQPDDGGGITLLLQRV